MLTKEQAIEILSSDTIFIAVEELKYKAGFNQKKVLKRMYHARKNHKLDEWRQFCRWCESLPFFKEICIDTEPRTSWIPCKEELPKESGEYLCTLPSGSMMVLDYSTKHMAWNAYDIFETAEHSVEVKAWMPLPKAYQGE